MDKKCILVPVKQVSKVNSYLKYTGLIVILVLLVVVSAYKYSQPVPKKDYTPLKTPAASTTKPAAKKMAPGAACCKVSFSRAKMLSVKNAHTSIAPACK